MTLLYSYSFATLGYGNCSKVVSGGNVLVCGCDNLASAQKSGNVQFKTKQKFSTLFTPKDVDFMHFKVFRTENILK